MHFALACYSPFLPSRLKKSQSQLSHKHHEITAPPLIIPSLVIALASFSVTTARAQGFRRGYNPIKVIKGYTIRDYNNDGWDDMWLLQCECPPVGGQLANFPAHADEDYDKDGISNYDEMLTGGNPWPKWQKPVLTPAQIARSRESGVKNAIEAKRKADEDAQRAQQGLSGLRLAIAESALGKHKEVEDLPTAAPSPLARAAAASQEAAMLKNAAEKEMKQIKQYFSEEQLNQWRTAAGGAMNPKARPGLLTFEEDFTISAARFIGVAALWPPAVVPAGVAPSSLLDLTGAKSAPIGQWEVSGRPFAGHTEFVTGGTNGLSRILLPVEPANPAAGISTPHATQVAGCIIAAGVSPLTRGMAFSGQIVARDVQSDLLEMEAAAAGGMRLSNHSYGLVGGWRLQPNGWAWLGSAAPGEDPGLGLYEENARRIDAICCRFPHYLPVLSAGNLISSGFQGPVNATGVIPPGTLYRRNHDDDADGVFVNEIWATGPAAGVPANRIAAHAPNAGIPLPGAPALDASNTVGLSVPQPPQGMGCDTLRGYQVSKNSLVVGAVEDLENGVTDPTLVRSAFFSSRGPTDDSRVKPDLVANGTTFTTTDILGTLPQPLPQNASFEDPMLANGTGSFTIAGWSQSATANGAEIRRQNIIDPLAQKSDLPNHLAIRAANHQVWQDYAPTQSIPAATPYEIRLLIGRRPFNAADGSGTHPLNSTTVLLFSGASGSNNGTLLGGTQINAATFVSPPTSPDVISWRPLTITFAAASAATTGTLRLVLANAGPGHSYFDHPQLYLAQAGVSVPLATSGTSYASPTVTGGLALVDEFAIESNMPPLSGPMRKTLLINSAEDATKAPPTVGLPGVNFVGPDPLHGWGVAQFTKAITLLDQHCKSPGRRGHLWASALFNNNTINKLVQVEPGTARLQATITYIDPAWQATDGPTRLGLGVPSLAGPTPATADPTTSRLVNDLDLEIIAPGGAITQAWKLSAASPTTPATRGDNDVENVKQVTILNPVPGTYTIRIRQDGPLKQAIRLLPGQAGYGTPEADNAATAENEATAPRYALVPAGSHPFALVVDGNKPSQADIFRIVTYTQTAAGHTLQWQSIQGVVYLVERSVDLQT